MDSAIPVRCSTVFHALHRTLVIYVRLDLSSMKVSANSAKQENMKKMGHVYNALMPVSSVHHRKAVLFARTGSNYMRDNVINVRSMVVYLAFHHKSVRVVKVRTF